MESLLQQEERVVGFFNSYPRLYPVSRDLLCDMVSNLMGLDQNRLSYPHADRFRKLLTLEDE
jgi:hypothetical protein